MNEEFDYCERMCRHYHLDGTCDLRPIHDYTSEYKGDKLCKDVNADECYYKEMQEVIDKYEKNHDIAWDCVHQCMEENKKLLERIKQLESEEKNDNRH